MQLVDAPVCSEGTSAANAWILGVMAVFIGLLLCALMISMFLINRLRSENKRSTSAGVLDGIGGGHSSNTITPSGRGPWSDRELIAASPRSGSRASGSNPFVSSPHAPQDERVPSTGPYSKVAAGSFGSTIGGTVRFGEGDSGSGSHSSGSGERTDGDSKASLGKSLLTLKDGIGGSRRRPPPPREPLLRCPPFLTAIHSQRRCFQSHGRRQTSCFTHAFHTVATSVCSVHSMAVAMRLPRVHCASCVANGSCGVF